MKITVINGSPRADRSGTLNITKAFLTGIRDVVPDCTAEEFNLSKMNIKPCRGCFCCWSKTPGECVIHDDVRTVMTAVLSSDIVIESFPLYFFGMPSILKQLTDRMLPLTLAYGYEISPVSAKSFHEFRYKELCEKKLVLITSCGYTQTDKMYGALLSQFDLICGEGNYTCIMCPQGELLHVEQMKPRLDRYFGIVREAGMAFARDGRLDVELLEKLKAPLLSPKGFEMLARSHWVK